MNSECCPQFDPAPWSDATLTWENRRFVKDRVRSLFHIPINFGSVMKRNMTAIEALHAKPATPIVLSDENSLWGADVYIETTSDIPHAVMTTISGTFLSRVYEGPYQNVHKWIEDTKNDVSAKGKTLKKIYIYYTTCPKCAKKYGKNYVVVLAQISC
jgi:hypothetical protein